MSSFMRFIRHIVTSNHDWYELMRRVFVAGVLEEIIERDESDPRTNVISCRLRAKILSSEGRSPGDVTIPVDAACSRLVKWRGLTILPDGKVVELPRSGCNGT